MPSLPDIRERTLLHAFERALKNAPDKVAQIERGTRYTYGEIYERSLAIAGGLLVGRGTPVASLLDNSLDYAHLLFGLGLVGSIQVAINTAYKGRFLAHLLADSRATVLVIEEHYVERLVPILDEVPDLVTVVVRGGKGAALKGARLRVLGFDEVLAAPPAPAVRSAESDLQAYFYTSGTTGKSKGVRVPYAHAYTYASREDDRRFSANDRSIVTLPLFHLAGQLYGVYQCLIAGASCVVEPVFSVSKFWPTVREHGCTFTLMLGSQAQMLVQQPPAPDDANNPLTHTYMAPLVGDPKAFSKRFGIAVGGVYGTTECGAPLRLDPDDLLGSECGVAREGYQCRVVDDTDHPVPRGTVGELVIRTDDPWVMNAGYLNRPDATAEVWKNQWLHTGDAFKQDESGRFYFMDRIKDALRRRGENVSSFEVESVINEHPLVSECAVVGVASELGEEEIKAVLVLRDGESAVDFTELTQFLVPRMPYFMVPRYLEVVRELPKTPTLKVQKNVLRDVGLTESTWDREKAGIVVNRRS